MEAALFIVVVLFVYFYLFPGERSTTDILYEDKGRSSKLLSDTINSIRSKPDMIIGPKHSSTLIEYKSRKGRIYASDIAQVYAGVLSARGSGFSIGRAEVHTQTEKKLLNTGSDEMILEEIRLPLHNARLVASGGIPEATPVIYKCRSCSYNNVCPHAVVV